MKQLIFALGIVLLFSTCQKEVVTVQQGQSYIEYIQSQLRAGLSDSVYQLLDFGRALLSKSTVYDQHFLRVPFNGEKLSDAFFIVKTDEKGFIEAGRNVRIDYKKTKNGIDSPESIIILSLDNKVIVQSAINRGYITAFHSNQAARSNIEIQPSANAYDFPEVTFTGYGSDIYSYSNYIWLNSMFVSPGEATQTSGGGYPLYSPYDGNTSNSTDQYIPDYGDGPTPDNVQQEDMIELEPEYIYSLPAINVAKFFNCFDNVPSTGASYSITLCVDVASNTNPASSGGSSPFSAGHTYLTVTKSNGSSSVTQSFGFYPETDPSLTSMLAPTKSCIRDNGGQEYNASIKMYITESEFDRVKSNALSLVSNNYSLDQYNCSNYAMDIFNSVRSNALTVAPVTIYMSTNSTMWGISSSTDKVTINKSPQMLFATLEDMKNGNSMEANNINIDLSHNSRSGISKGECN